VKSVYSENPIVNVERGGIGDKDLVQNLNVMNKKIPGEALSNIVEANMIKKKMETNKMN
jgi:hypothetical protein